MWRERGEGGRVREWEWEWPHQVIAILIVSLDCCCKHWFNHIFKYWYKHQYTHQCTMYWYKHYYKDQYKYWYDILDWWEYWHLLMWSLMLVWIILIDQLNMFKPWWTPISGESHYQGFLIPEHRIQSSLWRHLKHWLLNARGWVQRLNGHPG